jgi:antitoxin ParD1/3/4
MNVSLTKELEQLVAARVKTGRYLSASEVIREALRLLEERDQLHQLRLAELRRDVKKGLDQLDRGLGGPLDATALKQRLRAEFLRPAGASTRAGRRAPARKR